MGINETGVKMTDASKLPQLIGISGSFASGKDTVAHFLEETYGFTHISTGDMVREVALRERGSIERPVLFEVAQAHRREFGAGAFVKKAIEKPRPLVITGIRSLGEAKAITHAGGIMLFVDAPTSVRYERMKVRHRDQETELSLEEFHANEEKEWHAGETDADFNLRDIKATADYVVENTTALPIFLESVVAKIALK